MAKQQGPQKKELEEFDIDEFRSSAVGFFEKNRKIVYGVLFGLIVVIGGLYVYFVMYQAPRNKKASEEVFRPQAQFEQDSFQLALKGNQVLGGTNSYMGLLDIIDEYGGTDASNIALYDAGSSLLHEGKFEEAIKYLKKYNGKDKLTQAMAYGMIGDANSELNNLDEALSFYEKAANHYPNPMTTPVFLRKAGLLKEYQGDKAAALEYFKEASAELEVFLQKKYESDQYRSPQAGNTSKYPDLVAQLGTNLEKDIVRVGGK